MWSPLRFTIIFGLLTAYGVHIAEYIEQNSSLQTLYLAINRLGDEGTEVLSRALQQNRTLQRLCLANNRISGVGCGVLLNSLKASPALLVIPSDASLQGHSSLLHLDLGYAKAASTLGELPNWLGASGGDHLADFINIDQPQLKKC